MAQLGRPCRRSPAPGEIAEACAAIRSTWDERTYRVRAGYCENLQQARDYEAWTPPVIAVRDLMCEFDGERD
jgi:hypothetical protein